jgi:hypothetical protein
MSLICHSHIYLEICKLNQNTQMANRKEFVSWPRCWRLKWGSPRRNGNRQSKHLFPAAQVSNQIVSNILLSNSSHVHQDIILGNQEASSLWLWIIYSRSDDEWVRSSTDCQSTTICFWENDILWADWTTWTPGTREPAFGEGNEINRNNSHSRATVWTPEDSRSMCK